MGQVRIIRQLTDYSDIEPSQKYLFSYEFQKQNSTTQQPKPYDNQQTF